jgi:hypothetical protein
MVPMDLKTEFTFHATPGGPSGGVYLTRVGGTSGTHVFLDSPPEKLYRELLAAVKWLEANTDQDVRVILT